ncbi:hypothetical protein K443DRAFT_221853 [Laccaria amethystina LaAM-08-1]|uniref:Uncharacterized protein n=1 Tax=Laccaria amethystina LaAM-08-1 TaxID=1095629 RepID=A0A0C9X9K9_9AGAR|nr:hypothetical protein K443DRAFT_221853 [Laccaria amethystina LaAM-08-1]
MKALLSRRSHLFLFCDCHAPDLLLETLATFWGTTSGPPSGRSILSPFVRHGGCGFPHPKFDGFSWFAVRTSFTTDKSNMLLHLPHSQIITTSLGTLHEPRSPFCFTVSPSISMENI